MLTEEKNRGLLNERISQLDLREGLVLAFDFDELAVPIHLTRKVTERISKPIDRKKLVELGACSFEGIKYLNGLAKDQNFSAYTKVRDKLVKKTPWTKDFDEIIKELSKTCAIIFISSGMKDICQAKLKEINFNENNIIGGEIQTKDNKIKGSKLIISDKLKGYVIKKIRQKHKIIAIGHSLGDKNMLENANVSIALNPNTKNLAKHTVSSIKELKELILKNS